MRGARTGRPGQVGQRFRLVPIKHLKLDRADPHFEHDLNADVAAALLDVHASQVWRFTHHGRASRHGYLVRLPAFWPYGVQPRARAYYSLADLESFAVAAWKQPRAIHYDLIPRWYALKHHRRDLLDLVQPAPPTPEPSEALAGLSEDEREAVRRGFPRGAYVDGDDVFSPTGVLLNPGPDASDAVRALAAREILALVDTPPV